MGNHAIAYAVGPAAEVALRDRKPGETALDILDRLCESWRGCDAEWEAQDPNRPGHIHPDFGDYTDPHPKAALGMLMVEAFAPNGLADLPKYQYIVQQLRSPDEPYDDDKDQAACDAWWSEVYGPFKKRYEFC